MTTYRDKIVLRRGPDAIGSISAGSYESEKSPLSPLSKGGMRGLEQRFQKIPRSAGLCKSLLAQFSLRSTIFTFEVAPVSWASAPWALASAPVMGTRFWTPS